MTEQRWYYPLLVNVEPYLKGVRIDTFLGRHLRNYSPFRIQRMIRAGLVSIENAPATLKSRVRTGDRVQIRLVDPPDKLIPPEPIPLDILFEDDWLIAVNKPAGMVVHPVSDFDTGCLAHALQHHLDLKTGVRGLLRPGIVHRLDRMTSGVIVTTSHHLAHRELSIQFQNKQVHKSYLALVDGLIQRDSFDVRKPIGQRPSGDSILMSAHPDARHAKPAETHIQVLQRFPHATLVRAQPRSGRFHQIRVHLAEIGHPVVGDEYYGAGGTILQPPESQSTQPVPSTTQLPTWLPPNTLQPGRHLLHAERIEFTHPVNANPMTIEAPLTHDFHSVLQTLESQSPRL